MIKHIVFSVIIFVMMLLTSCQYRITNKAWVNDSLVLDKTHITESNGGGTSSYAFRDFSSIDVGGVVDVVYTQGNNYSVRIEEVSNLMTVVKKNNHELSVYTKRPKGKLISIGNEKRPKVFITSPHLNKLNVHGASLFTSKTMNQSNMSVDVSGASKVKLGHVDCSKLNMDVSGASKLSADVKAIHLTMDVSGASNADINFLGKTIKTDNSGASHLTLNLDCEELEAGNSGAANLTVTGFVDEVKISKSGAAKIDTLKLNKE